MNHFPGDNLGVRNHRGTSLIRGQGWEYFEDTNTIELYNFPEEETEVEVIYELDPNF